MIEKLKTTYDKEITITRREFYQALRKASQKREG
jgi:hypothetical protein